MKVLDNKTTNYGTIILALLTTPCIGAISILLQNQSSGLAARSLLILPAAIVALVLEAFVFRQWESAPKRKQSAFQIKAVLFSMVCGLVYLGSFAIAGYLKFMSPLP